MTKVINFYKAQDEYGVFSNFDTHHPIRVDGKNWPSTEHYFQAMKFLNPKLQDEIRFLLKPMAAAKAGRDRFKPLRKDWEEVKDDIMMKALRAKFTQHPDARSQLLDTEDAILVEHTVNDSYWGDGGDGSGKNMLGKLLMKLRQEIRYNEIP